MAARRAASLALAVVLGVGMVACGDDDDEAADTTTTAAPKGEAVVDIDMTDYAYTVSGALTEGGALRVKNTGAEMHMIGVGKLKPGKTITDLAAAFQQMSQGGEGEEEGEGTSTTASATTAPGSEEEHEEGDDPTSEVIEEVEVQGGQGIFQPGGPAVEISDTGLSAGDYALVCFINVAGEQEIHAQRGMVAALKVVDGTAPAAPTVDATYKLEKGKAVTGPATLTAGRHVFKLEGTGEGAGDLEPTLFRLNPGATLQQADRVFKSWDETGIPKNGVSQIPGLVVFGLFDIGERASLTVATELTAGTYYLIADDTDDDDEAFPPKELIKITVT